MSPADCWRCDAPEPVERDPSYCRNCGSPVEWHPVDVCCECQHLVCFHGRDTEGCGRINAAGWCECREAFGRDLAEHVRYW